MLIYCRNSPVKIPILQSYYIFYRNINIAGDTQVIDLSWEGYFDAQSPVVREKAIGAYDPWSGPEKGKFEIER